MVKSLKTGLLWFVEDFIEPQEWPEKWRHRFVLFAPITVPLWAAIALMLIVGLLLCLAILIPVTWLANIWVGKDG